MREELGQLIQGTRTGIKVVKRSYQAAKWLWGVLAFIVSHFVFFLVVIGLVVVVSFQQSQQIVSLKAYQDQIEGGDITPIPPIDGDLIFPLDDFRITCGFTCYENHNGLDMSGGYGASIRTVMNGTVVKVVTGYASNGGYIGHPGGYGNQVVIQHENGIQTRYAHLVDSIRVSIGETVVVGQIIAQQGNSGNSSGSHLHFEWMENGMKIDPMTRLPFVTETNPSSVTE